MLVGALLIAATVLPLWRHQGWWVRVFDFPRLQIAAGLLLVAGAHALIVDGGFGAYAFRAALMLCLALQLWRMVPYTRLVSRQVQDGTRPTARNGIRLMFANVLQSNRDAHRLLELTRENDPDVILALETDAWWAQALSGLATTHPHKVLRPQDNTYGMVLYSRLELVDPQVRFLIEPDVPSIHTGVRLRSGREVGLHCLHPRPPAPQESHGSVERDAELLIVGRSVKAHPGPVIVMGDMNDVAWSHTSTLFRKISGLLDPASAAGSSTPSAPGTRCCAFRWTISSTPTTSA